MRALCINMHAHTHTHISTHIFTHTYMQTPIHTHMCTHTTMFTTCPYIYAYTYEHMHTLTQSTVHTHAHIGSQCTHMYTNACTFTDICALAQMHAYTYEAGQMFPYLVTRSSHICLLCWQGRILQPPQHLACEVLLQSDCRGRPIESCGFLQTSNFSNILVLTRSPRCGAYMSGSKSTNHERRF